MIRRALAFWLTAVLLTAAVAAWESWVVGNLEPDFGDAFGNFGTVVGIMAVLTIPAAISHGFAALLLRENQVRRGTSAVVTSVISAAVYLALVNVVGRLPLNLPVKPLLIPCAIAFLASLLVLAVAKVVSQRAVARAA